MIIPARAVKLAPRREKKGDQTRENKGGENKGDAVGTQLNKTVCLKRESPLGRVRMVRADARGRALVQVEAGGGVHFFERDGDGRLIEHVDPMNRVTTYERDELGYVTARRNCLDAPSRINATLLRYIATKLSMTL